MNPRYIIACIVVWAFMFFFEGCFHGKILDPFYQATANLWRTPTDMQASFHWLVAGQMIFAFLFGYVFTKGYENKGVGEGARYGLLIGLILAPANMVMYAVQPLPVALVAAWCVGGVLELAAAGMILAAIYRPVRPIPNS